MEDHLYVILWRTSDTAKWKPLSDGVLSSRDEVDIVLAYIPAIDQVCCFGPEFFENKNNIYIRFEPAKNKQKKCVFADDHLW